MDVQEREKKIIDEKKKKILINSSFFLCAFLSKRKYDYNKSK